MLLWCLGLNNLYKLVRFLSSSTPSHAEEAFHTSCKYWAAVPPSFISASIRYLLISGSMFAVWVSGSHKASESPLPNVGTEGAYPVKELIEGEVCMQSYCLCNSSISGKSSFLWGSGGSGGVS